MISTSSTPNAPSILRNENLLMENIADMVRNKQQELNNIHDLHIQQLEKAIDERNKLLNEASKKFNLLRDDFQYNLTLLEARDQEIQRLSQIEVNLLNDLEVKENEIKKLLQKIDKIQLKESENYQKYQAERSKTKKFLLELQEEAESLRWSTNEDMNMKNKEIEYLKSELHRAHLERKEALDMQRNELTKTYEALLSSKDEEFLEKEKEISQQIVGLEARFQQLTSDNSRLKSDLNTLFRKHEKLGMVLSQKEEKCIQLEWALNDKEQEKQESENKLHRKIQQLESELTASLTTIEHLKVEAKREVEKTKIDSKRDQEYVNLKVQHWEELYHNSCADIGKLEKTIEELQSTCHNHKKEIEILRPKIHELDELKATLANQIKQSTNKIESLNEQNIRLERELVVAQKELEILHFDKERLSKELEEKEEKWIVTERDLTKQLVSMKHEYEEKLRVLDSNHEKRKDTEMELLRADMEAHFITQLSDRETEMNDDITRYKELNDQLNREIAILKNEKIHYQGLYEEEKTESGALRLRIQLLSNQQNSSYPPPPLPAADPQKQTIKQSIVVPSPMFSEDMGVLSIPASPSTPYSPRYEYGKHIPSLPPTHELNEDGSKSDYQFNETMSSFGQSEQIDGRQKHNNTAGSLSVENSKLKAIIREMRTDMESMQGEMSTVISEKQDALNRVNELETRLQNAIGEVNKLRAEKKRLMDLNNELRSNLHKQRMEHASIEVQQPTPVSSVPLEQPPPVEAAHSPFSLSATGKSLKPRASDRQTPSQEAALSKLKEKATKQQSQSNPSSHPRRVVNYSRQENFMSQH